MAASQATEPYPSCSLNPHRHSIRILHVLPGTEPEAISCKLTVVSLDDDPVYDALSYAWGDPNIRVPILVNSCSIHVTINLCAALRRIRHAVHERRLWVDAVCINQSDINERTSQVNMMGQIYSGAREVLLWLCDSVKGPSLTSSSLRSNLADSVLSRIDSLTDRTNSDRVAPKDIFTYTEVAAAIDLVRKLASNQHLFYLNEESRTEELNTALQGLHELLNCAWWHRMWTVQEAVLPATATILCGPVSVSWAVFSEAAAGYMKHWNDRCCVDEHSLGPDGDRILDLFYNRVDTIHWFRDKYHQGERHKLIELINEFRPRVASDARDKIFGLLGLATTGSGVSPIKADYTLRPASLYQDLITTSILDEKNLYSLLRQEEKQRHLDIPTWCPDWTAIVDDRLSTNYNWVRRQYRNYSASGSKEAKITQSSNPSRLGLQGVCFDEIVEVGQLPVHDKEWHTEMESWKSLYNQTATTTASAQYTDFEYALWRLACMDLIEDASTAKTRRATLEDYHAFRAQNPPHGYSFSDHGWAQEIHRFFVTKRGFMGLGPFAVLPGDRVHVLFGGNVPFVLRLDADASEQEAPMLTYVGQCYVQGIMDGEVLEKVEKDEGEWVYMR